MKHLFNFLSFAAIAAMTAISCNKEIETPAVGTDDACPEGYYVEELTAVYPHDPETRTAFNETTGRFAWTEGDELAFHLSNGEYVAAPIDPATGKVKLYLPVGVTRDNYAVYPASAIVDDAAAIGNMKITVPDTYDISADPRTDYVPTPLVAWNAAENTHLKFEHVGGLLQVNLKVPAGVKTATVSMGKTIAGTFSLEDGTGNGIIVPGESSSDGITFILSESGLAEDTQVKLLTPLPTGSYDLFKVNYDNGFEFKRDLSANPWVFARSGGKKVSIAENNFEDPTDYFWIEALEPNMNVYVWCTNGTRDVGIHYSVDNKRTWQLYNEHPSTNYYNTTDTGGKLSTSFMQYITLENVGDRVYFYATGSRWFGGSQTGLRFSANGRYACGGDITTLIEKNGGEMYKNVFAYLFSSNGKKSDGSPVGCEDASRLVLPDYTVENCYYSMFGRNLNTENSGAEDPNRTLKKAPYLPAKVIAPGAYYRMFFYCTELVDVPDFYVESIGGSGCMSMFSGCWKLPKTPMSIKEGTPIADYGMSRMYSSCRSIVVANEIPCGELTGVRNFEMTFASCKNLKTPPSVIPHANTSMCCDMMFYGCTSLTYAPELPEMNLGVGAYDQMFGDCTSLINAPHLPAIDVPDSGYHLMFDGCSALVEPPVVDAVTLGTSAFEQAFLKCTSLAKTFEFKFTTIGNRCFFSAFSGCTSLTEASDLLPAEVPYRAYYYMFSGCTSLASAPAIHAKTVYQEGCMSMFKGCSSMTGHVYLPVEITYGGSTLESMFAQTGIESIELELLHCWASSPNADGTYNNASSATRYMFSMCSNLTSIKVHFKEWITNQWVGSVAPSGTFYKPADLYTPSSWSTSTYPRGWTVVDF